MSSVPAETRACIGLPEPDGGLPFVLLGIRGDQGVLLLGTTGAEGSEGTPGGGIEHLVSEPDHARAVFETALHHHNLLNLPFHVGLHFVERAFDGNLPEGWEALLSTLDEGTQNAARLLNPLRGFPTQIDAKVRIESILEEERGIAFGIDEAVVETVFNDLMGVVNSPIIQAEEGRRRRLAKIIDRASDEALDAPSRMRWVQSLQAMAWLCKEQGWEEVWKACWHTSLAMGQERKGSEIPFVRIWVERQLAMTVHTAMSMMGPGTLAERISSAEEGLEN